MGGPILPTATTIWCQIVPGEWMDFTILQFLLYF